VAGIEKKNGRTDGWTDGREDQDRVLVECNAKDLDKSNLQMVGTIAFFLSSDSSRSKSLRFKC